MAYPLFQGFIPYMLLLSSAFKSSLALIHLLKLQLLYSERFYSISHPIEGWVLIVREVIKLVNLSVLDIETYCQILTLS